ncbi:hypothetical protein C1H46_023766 [Malus baccata]|uniref:Cytochrome P450 n=1 Tax=Malus baccata TaxID=106549 RepID=A0A540LWB9_MALBA|nr:hypothetical protein C1H46_023766 [Malus baccata]
MTSGAFDTSATAIVWNLAELLRHPRVMKLLQQELQTVIGRDRTVEESDLPKLAYLNKIVKETRMSKRALGYIRKKGCPGMQLGLTMVRLALVNLVHCFNFDLPSGLLPNELDMTETFGQSLSKTIHLLVVPTYRLHD